MCNCYGLLGYNAYFTMSISKWSTVHMHGRSQLSTDYQMHKLKDQNLCAGNAKCRVKYLNLLTICEESVKNSKIRGLPGMLLAEVQQISASVFCG